MGHQVTVKEVKDDCFYTLASSHGDGEGKLLSMYIDPINKSLTFEVMDTIKKRGRLCATLKEAVEIYNAI